MRHCGGSLRSAKENAKNTEGIGENPKLKTTGLASSEASRFWLPSTFR
jgi:hypothetical protein